MVTGWRRALCTSIPKEKQQQQQQQQCDGTTTNIQSPRISSKFGYFFSSSSSSNSTSNPSTPRLLSQPVSSPSLRCRTTAISATAPTTPNSSLPNSPKLKCNTTPNKSSSFSPRLFQRSSPSSPKSPSSFSLLKSTLRLNSKSRCGICLQSVKSGQGTAIFTAECSHSFHFPCVAAAAVHGNNQPLINCPVCSATWKELPLVDIQTPPSMAETEAQSKLREVKTKALRVYDDDEPLMSPTSGARFNPIPESDEENDAVEFQGFFVNSDRNNVSNRKSVEFSLLPVSAVVAAGKTHETHAVVLKVKAPQLPESRTTSLTPRRAPIDIVTVVDVSASNSRSRIQETKRALRLIVSSLSDADRLSVVAFSSTSKRLLPLRRMTSAGRRSARRIVDALCGVGHGMCVNDALKKAAKVLQDRREKNPNASIILLSDIAANHKRSSPFVSSTRFPQLDIPVHTVGLAETTDDAFVKCVGGLLSVVVKDVNLQPSLTTGSANAEISAVYSLSGRPTALGSGSTQLGDLYAGEERELLVELKVPVNHTGSHSQNSIMSVRSTYRDPTSNELVYSKERVLLVPRSQSVRSSTSSSNPNIQRLRNLHVTARAVAESRRFLERNDFSGAYHLLTSARALLMQSSSASAEEFLRGLEAELAELHRGRRQQQQSSVTPRPKGHVEAEKPEPLTPTSAWRAAERLAKVAMLRKSMNRVSDLHGFENARF